jgi:phosphoglycerate dehydrogenase-like enzyme
MFLQVTEWNDEETSMGTTELTKLRSILLLMDVPDWALGEMRSQFPDVTFIVPGEDEPEADVAQYSGVRREPTLEELATVDGVVGWRITLEMLDEMPRLRWIQAGGAGVNSYDLGAIAGRGIVLTNASGVAAPNIAEHIMGMMLALARRLPILVRSQVTHQWRDHATHREVRELLGATLLIVGVGDIGRELAQRAGAFGMEIIGVRRRGSLEIPGFAQLVSRDELPRVVGGADHIAITLPETTETRGMFDAELIAKIKPGAILYNVGRGPVVDTPALIAALESGHLGGAGLDVTDPEPLPDDSPLWDMENVLITSHTSGSTPRYWQRLLPLVTDNIRRIQAGEKLQNVVDPEAGY